MADETNAHSSGSAQVSSNMARVCVSCDVFRMLKTDLETEARLWGFPVSAMRTDVFEMLLVEMFNEQISPQMINEHVQMIFGQWMKARG